MKVIAINGSPRKNGNTQYAIDVVAEEVKKEGIEFETLHIGNETFKGCTACMHCMINKTGECIIKSDNTNKYIDKMLEADAIILGSPTYFANISGNMKPFLDRAFLVMGYGSAKGGIEGKIGASIIAVRRTGGMQAYNALNSYFSIKGVTVPGSTYWNIIHGMMPGDAANDAEGIQTMRTLGKNIAYLLNQKEAAKIEKPQPEEKILTNFIR